MKEGKEEREGREKASVEKLLIRKRDRQIDGQTRERRKKTPDGNVDNVM